MSYDFWTYEMLKNRSSRLSLLSSLERRGILSMARLGSLRSLSFTSPVSYYRETSREGVIQLPLEFSKLLPVIRDADVWYDGDGAHHNRDNAFRLCLFSDTLNEVHCIWVLYAINSGIVSLEFDGFRKYACNVPLGFSISDLASLISLGDDAIKDFILKHGKLTKIQFDRIIKIGL